MSFGFGRNSGPVAPPNGQNPFGHSPRPPSPQPPTSPFPDYAAAPRFPSPRPRPQSPQLPGSTLPDFQGGQRFPSPRPRLQSPQPQAPSFPDFQCGQRFPSPRPRLQSPQPPAPSFPDFPGGQRFPSPRPRLQSPQPPAPSFPEFSAAPRFPSPRTREAVILSPSSIATPHSPPPFSQPSYASSRDSSVRWNDRQSPIRDGFGNLNQRTSSTQDVRTRISSKVSPSQDLESSRRPSVQYNEDFLNDRDSSVQWNDRQNPISGGFGNLNQRTSSTLDVGTSISSKVSPSQNLESSRRPPILYNEDFLNDGDSSVRWNDRQSPVRGGIGNLNQRTSSTHDVGASISSKVSPSQDLETSRRPPVHYSEEFLHEPFTNAMEGNADNGFDRHVASKRRQSPFSAVASNNSVINPTAPSSKPQRPSLSPPRSRSGSGAVSDSEYSQRMSPSADGMNGNSSVTSIPSPSRTKRTRSPPAASGQVFLRSSASNENDIEREEQAKAKRLARFRTELDDVEPSVSVQRDANVTQNKKSSLLKAVESKNAMEDLSQDHDNEDLDSTGISIIVGLCPDMCPESERGERERKGDLDRYERLDGDRNHTSKILAVKKYTRTAEREAELIRPMPILQKTMDYLLGLLDQPYDDKVLGLYNFLWDRMRAIRMDLRMQHIFNHQAITMLEQMIRLHVLAMHELCEFSKGEGFSEGFDAHLNIEQMNKTLVELFQLYDDHRKKGLFIPTEKEFRGYYALLKLDKHPGHKVEPGELSLDLAKMTPGIRQTQEILFARDVARHARKATYLQACLMHAHFSKLRTQALASLHSGLQYGQGLPVTHVAKWLGMEGEDIESLLEYHGFLTKDFEEPYMVKDGPFLNDDKDYPTRCSMLVHKKKSNKVVEDVLSSHEIMLPPKTKKVEKNDSKLEAWQPVQTKAPPKVTDDLDIKKEAVTPPTGSMQAQPNFEGSSGMQAQPNFEGLSGMQVRPVPGSRLVQPFNENQRISIGSPRSSTKVPKTFASLRSHGLQEQPSPVTPKSSPIILGDGQLSHKSPSWTFSSDQFVRATSTSFDDSKGPIQVSPKNIVHSEFKATPSPPVSEDVRELILTDSVDACAGDTSRKAGIFVEELIMDKFNDVQEEVENHDVDCDFDKEVAEAKLRLLLRLWRRRFARKKNLREVNRVAANAALSSLSLGPPLWQSKDKPVHPERLNIDKAVHERYENWQESRVRWNVSDLVAAKLAEKSAIPNCVCWKVISFSWMDQGTYDIEARNSLTHLSLDEWLHYKLIPSIKDEPVEGLAMSVPGLSVWRKWAPSNSTEPACYLSVIKDITSNSSQMKLVGASAMLFPISETVPWDVQRSHLHSLAMSLPVEACIPLLIISGSRQDSLEDISSTIAAKLGLEELDRSRIGSYSIIYLNKREDMSQYHGYFSNQKLKDGLIWLASESRPQPLLSCVTTRELVSLHLNLCLDALDLVNSDRVGPNQYISAFNEALDRTISDIITASKANPTGWPCPEVFLLDESTAEFRAVKKFLPSLGWSSSEELEPFMSALGNCKLPRLPGDFSWLSKGCSSEAEIEEQRQSLQDCLISYLTQTSNLMYWMMAAKEASLMVQNCTRLELLETEYKLIPSWALIFRRVFNWQLNSAAIFSHKAYVLEQSNFNYNPQFLKKLEMDVHMHHFSVHPSLDEMVEVTCSPIVLKRVRSSPKSSRNVAARTSGESTVGIALSSHVSEDENHHSKMQVVSLPDSDIHTVESGMGLSTKDEDDKLMQLLNQCNILQDKIEKKLSIYF